jgi:NADP-dependent 3-hydroxy acid dehydrogenase YdfG
MIVIRGRVVKLDTAMEHPVWRLRTLGDTLYKEIFQMFQGVALITGGSSGIGKAVAESLLKQQASVTICGRSLQRLQETVDTIYFPGAKLHAVQADVTFASQIENAVQQTVKQFGRLDALIHCAGVGFLGSLTETSEETIDRLLNINVKGAILTAKAVWPVMSAQKEGQIVYLCGILGMKTIPNAALYCTAKHAVSGLCGSLAQEGRRHGIRVTGIYCSGVDTPFWEGISGKPRADLLLKAEEVARSIQDLLALPPHLIPNQLVLQHISHQL